MSITLRRLSLLTAVFLLIGGLGLFLRYFPWVPFHPVCVNPHKTWNGFVWGPYILLRGDLRDDFQRVIIDSLYPRLVTRDGLYVTFDFYLDRNLYYNLTQRAVGSTVHHEFNPDHFDGFGRTAPGWMEKFNAGDAILMPKTPRRNQCEFTRFFAIEGAPPPKDIRQIFENRHLDHPEEAIDLGVRLMEHFIEKYRQK